MLEKAEKGQGLALKLSSLGLVKYQQPMKHTHAGIGIFPFITSQYIGLKVLQFCKAPISGMSNCHAPISCALQKCNRQAASLCGFAVR